MESNILTQLLKNNNKDLIIYNLDKLDDRSLLSVCQVNKQLNEICKSDRAENMWRKRVLKRFGEKAVSYKDMFFGNMEKQKDKERSWRSYFLDLVYLDETLIPDKAIEKAAEKGALDAVKVFIDKFNEEKDAEGDDARFRQNPWDFVILGAASAGNKELIDYVINNHGVKAWDYGLFGAALRGDKDLLNFFIDQGATEWYLGIEAAAERGDKDLIEFFLEKIRERRNYINELEGVMFVYKSGILDHGMYGAALGGRKDLVEFFIEKGARDWDYALGGAAHGGHKDLVEYFIEKKIEQGNYEYWKTGIFEAARGGRRDMIDYFINKLKQEFPDRPNAEDLKEGLYGAEEGGYKEMIKYFEKLISEIK